MSMREKAKKKANKDMNRGGNYNISIPDGTQKFVPKSKGPYHLDIIPYKVTVDNHPEVNKGELWFQRTYWVHFGLGEDGKKSAVCPKTFKKQCPVCDYYKELANSDDEDDREQAKHIKPKERELYNLIDLDDQDAGVKVFEYSWHNFGKGLSEEVNEASEEEAAFAELEGGKTLKVSFKKEQFGNGPPYYAVRRIDFEDREDYDEDILEDAVDLDRIINVPSQKEIEALLHGVDTETDEEEEEEEKPSKKKSSKSSDKKSSSKKKGKKSSDDEEEEGENEEEEKPKKGKKSSTKKSSAKKSKKSSDDDEDEEKTSKHAGKVKGKGKKKKTKCPGDGEYGEDIDNLDECEGCDIYAECMETYEANHDDDE